MGSFEFAFNNPKYSDRVLRLIVSDARKTTVAARLENSSSDNNNNNSMKEGGESGRGEMVSAALRPLKRRRCHSPPASSGPTTGLELLCQQQSTAAASISSDAVCEFLDDPVAVIAGSVINEGHEIARDIEDRYVNSVILAKESLFFRKIFDDECFKEANEKIVPIHLRPEEKAPFLDMLQFIYSSKMMATSAEDVAAVWLLAQQFLADECAQHCLQLLHAMPPTIASCRFFLDLASVVDQTEDVRNLMECSVTFLARHFTSATVMNGENPGRWDHLDDFKALPITALESLLASDLLQAVHEEAVFHALRVWTKANCKSSSEEREAWLKFGPLVRWPLIETTRLKALLSVQEAQYVRELLFEALEFKAGSEEEQQQMIASTGTVHHRFRRRERHALPVRCVALDMPVKHGTICFKMPLQEWTTLQKSPGPICSERFMVGGYLFIWLLQLRSANHDGKRRVSIGLVTLNAPQSALRIDITVGVWDVRSGTYLQRYKGAHTVRKDVRERIAMCLDCFGKDLDEILVENDGYLFHNATWFKTEVQVDTLDRLPS